MSYNILLRLWLLALAIAWRTIGYAQDSPNQEKAGVTPGVPLPTGLGFFANPDNYHRFTLGVQAGLGVSANSETFGYDNLSVNSRWRLGNNALGRRLHALVGFSDWRVPAYRKVFADKDIDPLPDQDRFAAQSANAASVGLAYSLGRQIADFKLNKAELDTLTGYDALLLAERLPTFLLASEGKEPLTGDEQQQVKLMRGSGVIHLPRKLTNPEKATLIAAGFSNEQLINWETNATTKTERTALLAKSIDPVLIRDLSTIPSNPILKEIWQKKRDAHFIRLNRKRAREGAFSLGALMRIASFTEETNLQAVDLYTTYAKGNDKYDFVFAFHHLRYVEKTLPHYAYTGAAGVFADLNDTDIFPVLGLTAGYGYYSFRELYEVIPEATKMDQQPGTKRLDVILSISGAPDKTNQTGAGIGIRYSYIDPKLRPAYSAVSLIFSSNFSLLK